MSSNIINPTITSTTNTNTTTTNNNNNNNNGFSVDYNLFLTQYNHPISKKFRIKVEVNIYTIHKYIHISIPYIYSIHKYIHISIPYIYTFI